MELRMQLRLLHRRREYIVTFFIMLTISVGAFLFNCYREYGSDRLEVLSAEQLFIGRGDVSTLAFILPFFVPLVLTIPFADSYFTDRSSRVLPVLFTRGSYKSYYFSKMAVVALSAATVIFVPFLVNYILGLIAFPAESINYFGELSSDQSQYYTTMLRNYLFPELFIKTPYLYHMVCFLLLTAFSALGAIIAYQVSFFIKKSRLLVLCSFFILYDVVVVLSNLLQRNRIPNFNPMDYLFAGNTASGKQPWMLGVIFAVMVAAIGILTPFCLRRLREIKE